MSFGHLRIEPEGLALVISWNGQAIGYAGLPVAVIAPWLWKWLESGVHDL